MVVLKKIKGSTLMETLVASVLIVIIFMLASMILNNLFSNNIKNNTNGIENKLNELHYKYLKNAISIPYSDNFEKWKLSIETINENGKQRIEFEAFNTETKKRLTKTVNEK